MCLPPKNDWQGEEISLKWQIQLCVAKNPYNFSPCCIPQICPMDISSIRVTVVTLWCWYELLELLNVVKCSVLQRYWLLCIAPKFGWMKPVLTLSRLDRHWPLSARVVSTTKWSLLKPFQFKWTFARVIYDFPNKRRWWGLLMAGLPAIALMGLERPRQ